ncbi:uncharacterized protein LOC112635996 [Theropithecus gelada]|uniref:uncharacterized protein LOC112635996 n=1 Tax=Theropithecus gelada TaxID=9565 RepID=UPI000DC17012|nr:uncharacterized protein LOC112635996 [Theropithecus gelada]
MHTALECEVTIKPRFVYIPSPRTGPVRGGDCESRDGAGVERENRTGESGLGPSGMRALGFRGCCSRRRRAEAERVVGSVLGASAPRVRSGLLRAAGSGAGGVHSACGASRPPHPPVEVG